MHLLNQTLKVVLFFWTTSAFHLEFSGPHTVNKPLTSTLSKLMTPQTRRSVLLEAPSLTLSQGEVVLLTGSSGSGKTLWMKEMMACLNDNPEDMMGKGMSISGAKGVQGLWFDRYTVARSPSSSSVSASIIEGVDEMLKPPCCLFVDELVDTESAPVRQTVFKGVSELCRDRSCVAVWATHKFEGLGGGRRIGLSGGRVIATELRALVNDHGNDDDEEEEEEEVEELVVEELVVEEKSSTQTPPSPTPISDALIETNKFFKKATIGPVRNFLSIPKDPPPASQLAPFEAALSPPTLPPIPRPVWLTISMSVPSGLLWYGYYKFSVEEELFQMELRETGSVSGAGGYGTLVGFSYAVIIGLPLSLLPLTEGLGNLVLQTAGILLLASQVNLYVRVNELCEDVGLGKPLHSWWALLPPPLDVVVGLRQVHYLALYATKVRGEDWKGDKVAEEWFPFISSERFTLEEFVREPRRWFRLPFLNTEDWEDFW
mmetsp:Transcript_8102/g.16356  ORF Transcript_8102/g.16356 Transcript_8102/m.16356 type:complete len:487 (+) Transcript_8102:93-1553(+)